MITLMPFGPLFNERIIFMDFQKSYYANVMPNRMVNLELTQDFLIPNVYRYSFSLSDNEDTLLKFLHLLGGGSIHTDFPVSFSFHPMQCCLVLYTLKGGGRITHAANNLSATEGALAFIDCNNTFSLHSLILPWNFMLFFIDGRDIELYRYVLPDFGGVFQTAEYSFIKNCFRSLLSVPTSADTSDILFMHKYLSEILSTICLSERSEHTAASENIPGYLIELYDLLEHQYAKNFSLDKCEELFHVSKYRLCREFSAAYGMPPLKYLIHRRLEEAKKMLLTTDRTVHEISSKVGYDNVNHFINLFKKNTGLTPGVFRQKALEAQYAQRFPSR